MKKFITSALPYVNNHPHLGNIIGCVLSGDVYNRYCRRNGEESVHICGTDEYGTAIEMEAISQGLTPEEICEKNREIHKRVYDWFEIDFDHFGFTSSPTHTELVQDIFMRIYNNGHFNEEDVEQLYCDGCELFLADRYVVGKCKFCGDSGARGDQCDECGHSYKPLDLISPRCSICGEKPKIKSSTHLFFDLGRFKPDLEELYRTNGHLWSQNAQNIFNQWIGMDLHSRCMTRDLKFKWGVPVPLERFKDKVFYVWFDAPIGYLTFLKELVKDEFDGWCNESELIQFMGKDNVSFHTVIFPAMLIATGKKFPLIKRLSVTEYLQFENKKFSKSRKHGIFGVDLIDGSMGGPCIWRYYLLKIRPESMRDANFSFYDFQQSVTADLINNLGNFINRVLKYIKSRCESIVKVDQLDDRDREYISLINDLYGRYKQNMNDIKLRDALHVVLEISKSGNEYLQEGVQNKIRMNHSFSLSFSVVGLIGNLLYPFIPSTSSEVLRMCNLNESPFPECMEIISDHVIEENIHPLFNHFTSEQIDEMKKYNKS